LHLATLFEDKCQYLLRLALISERGRLFVGEEAERELEALLKKHRTLERAITKFVTVAQERDGELLHKARETRNWIAHESARLSISGSRMTEIASQTMELRENVECLIAGDIIVSEYCEMLEVGVNHWVHDRQRALRYANEAIAWVLDGAIPKA